MNRKICAAAFLIGLAAICWVGSGYIGSGLLPLTMTLIIAAVYVTGSTEMLRFHRATEALAQALKSIPEDLSHPGEWLAKLPASLQNAVRLRIEGERVGLPGPAVTPYLVGLLVLLGMLGTFLGMVVTLNGAVLALESTTDLQTIRAALAAPVKGLGVAFGTSVAGVAASAMLGLISALCRRERLQTAQLLDTKVATALRGFSLAHQRQETYKALQLQATALPELATTMQAMMAQMERQTRELNERLIAEQERFYREAKGMYSELAGSVDQSLKSSLTESARLAGETIQPVVTETMAGIARETSALQERVAEAVQSQLAGISERFDTSVTKVSDTWTAALASHERTGEHLNQQLQGALAAYTDTFEQRSAALLGSVEGAHAALRANLAATTTAMAQETSALHARLAGTVEMQLDGVSARFDTAVGTVTDTWTAALAKHESASEALSGQMHRSLDAFTATFAERSASLLATVGDTAVRLQTELAAKDEARQAALTQALEAMAASLQQEWQQAGAHALAQQEQITKTLGDTARDIAATAQAQATSTIDEVSRLMETAAEAPRAAAEVIGQLRQELSASIARDNTLLAERSRIMETLGALLDAINHASTEQRTAIDALVASSTTMLECAGERFAASIDAESARIADVAGQITGGAVEVASLSEAFGLAVQLFSESNDKLMATLARIEGALAKSMTRSDEQLAYYVAQAREIIDLSIMSQRQIVEDLQQISGNQAAAASEV
ncbi:MAG TPA: DUF802 domain-containing protein [Aromatoleum sp.]|uniref:DUF802 domain-containing protein n=1 Tax=Aromatoleum sp. TaxID=2307007 RepID=UPI002B4A6E5D|nr:DUF802 domain-containing protein [Aromatoleum sp.]HJV24061.1 DUF802 domain-containing protein [Aromatoleum sp.]